LAQQEDKWAAHQEAMQQPAGAMRGQEGSATRGQQEVMQEPAGARRQWEGVKTRGQGEAMQQPAGATRQREGQHNKRTTMLKENSYVCYIILYQSLILELKFYKLYMF
jgi:hypothetical protein